MSEFTENTVILSLDCHKPGRSKQVHANEVTVSAVSDEERKLEQKRLRVNKRIWECEELDAIDQHMSKAKRYVVSQAQDVETIKDGMHAIAEFKIPTVIAKLREFVIELQPLKEDFRVAYPTLIEKTYEDLGPIVEPTDFKPIEVLLAQISISWRLLTFDVPEQVLRRIDAALLEEEKEKMQAHYADMTTQLETGLALGFQTMITKVQKSLKPGKDGKLRKIDHHAVEKYNEFMQNLLGNNTTHNEGLASLVEQARALINDATPEELSTNAGIRAVVSQGMERLAQELGELTVTKTGRKIVIRKPTENVGVDSSVMEDTHAG